MRYGVELDNAIRYAEIEATSLTEAWVHASRKWYRINSKYEVIPEVMVVFTLDAEPAEFMQAMRLDYSTTTGTGDPH